MSAPITIDTRMHGFDGITAVYVVRGSSATALIESGPGSSLDQVRRGLADAGVDSLDWIVVTHIHLDHAGGAAALAREHPDARVAVHPVGAPHLIDPSKLWRSAGRIYGDAMEQLWGAIEPLDAERVVTLGDRESLDLGGRKLVALDTPGHAGHHNAVLDESTGDLFTGDALGVRLQDAPFVRPATPPPEFDLEKALESIARIRDVAPQRLWFTHFGATDGGSPAEVCDEAAAALVRWNEWVLDARRSTHDVDAAATLLRERWLEHAAALPAEERARLEQTTSTWMNTWGYMRYHDRREGS